MKIRQVKITRFRGIKQLDWRIENQFACLIGPGDTAKSTILDAVEAALSPRSNLEFDDTDFHNADTSEPISIAVTISPIPADLMADHRYGLACHGWHSTEGFKAEPDGVEGALTIELFVDASLEPIWRLAHPRNGEERRVYARDRDLFRVAKLGTYLDRHFTWAKGSALARISADAGQSEKHLVEVNRQARKGLKTEEIAELVAAAKRAEELGKGLGVAPAAELKPALDVQAITTTFSSLALHDGEVPMRRAGLGSRRLLTIAMQYESAKNGGAVLVDEIELGLEPHRLRRLIAFLRAFAGRTEKPGHAFFTTHSPIVVKELDPKEMAVVRVTAGAVTIKPVSDDLRRAVKRNPEAVLAKKIIVCEGDTEIGFARGFDDHWSAQGLPPFATLGVALAEGGSTNDAAKIAQQFRGLGFEVGLLVDSDTPMNPDQGTLEALGIKVIAWADNTHLEGRLVKDLPWPGVITLLKEAQADGRTFESIRDSVGAGLPAGTPRLDGDILNWQDSAALRDAIGKAAHRQGWFKRVHLAQALATKAVVPHLAAISAKDLGIKLAALRSWVDGAAPAAA